MSRIVSFVLVILPSGTHKYLKVALVTGYAVFTKPASLTGKHTNIRAGETNVYDFVRVEACARYG